MRRPVESLSRRELLSLARRLSGGGRVPGGRAALAAYVRARLDPGDDPPAVLAEEEGVSWEEIEVRPRRVRR